MIAQSAKDLRVYKQAYTLAMQIFEASKRWPKEERYSLTDQIRRSSRAVCANLREAWSKRRYEAHFVSKLTDVDAENNETETWLDFARDCNYLKIQEHEELVRLNREIGGMIGTMLKSASSFILTEHQ